MLSLPQLGIATQAIGRFGLMEHVAGKPTVPAVVKEGQYWPKCQAQANSTVPNGKNDLKAHDHAPEHCFTGPDQVRRAIFSAFRTLPTSTN